MSALIQSSDIYLIEVTQFASGIHLSLHDALDNTQYINNLFIGYSRCYNAWLSEQHCVHMRESSLCFCTHSMLDDS